ncbi:hypothetical protein [Roseovarius salinarum]|uniref:hypothetical protein n=1 Tax=Roseovarius salinarum TaxID=1981892 RepID=UPI000C332D5F|nr:hypothetical protein [Roseovarius salinarum]
MLQLLRLVIFGFLFLTAVYVVVSLWSRSVRKRKLRREWEEIGRPGDRDAYVRAGMEDYDHSLRRKALLLVYIVPVLAVLTIIYVVNFM